MEGCYANAYICVLVMTFVAFVASFVMLTADMSKGKFWLDRSGSLRCPAYWCNDVWYVDEFEREWDVKIVLTVYHAALSALTLAILILAISEIRRRRRGQKNDETADAEAGIGGSNPVAEEATGTEVEHTRTRCLLAFGQHFFIPFGCLGGAIGNGFVLEPPLQSADGPEYLISLFSFLALFILNLLPCCVKSCQLTVSLTEEDEE
mmetsp:Transcript_21365/g.48210  ORF Transcript_21365/g.48210 Transcript_21365/m.48210 type:complete len:206 (-) Transcript_21365:183-800(-)